MSLREPFLSALILILISTVIAVGFVGAALFYATTSTTIFYLKVFVYTFGFSIVTFGFVFLMSK